MIIVVPTILALVFGGACIAVAACGDARSARRISLSVAVLVTTIAALGLFFPSIAPVEAAHWMPVGMLAIAPLVSGIVSLMAIGLAPLTSHRKTTFVRMLLLFAFAEASLGIVHPIAMIVLWIASSFVAWSEYREVCETRSWHRVFATYHVLSVGLFATGATLLWLGSSAHVAVAMVLLGIGIREGIIPFQSWFPKFVEQVPMGVVVAFVGPQLGVYAQLELLSPQSIGSYGHTIAAFGAATAVLAAILGVVQTDARRAVAYLILSQTGLVAFGLESRSAVGLTGAVLNWQVLAIATSGFAMALAALGARREHLNLSVPHGDFSQTPRLGTAFLLLGFASVGFPLTLGFIAEDLLVQGTVGEYPLLGLSLVVATAVNGITVLRSFFYLFTGSKNNSRAPDLGRRETFLLGGSVVLLIVFGLMPNPLVRFETPHRSHSAAQPIPHYVHHMQDGK